MRRVFASYDQLLATPVATLGRIGAALDLAWPHPPDTPCWPRFNPP